MSEGSLPRVLLILEDDVDSRELLGEYLRLHGYGVEEFGEPHGALTAIQDSPPAAVLLDITLGSDIDGFEVARRVRRDPTLAGVKLIAVSALPAKVVAQQDAPFDASLNKPLDLPMLAEVLAALLGATTAST